MTSLEPKILLTGATGYVGGSILSHLLSSTDPALKSMTISCLVRRQDQADTLSNIYGNRVFPLLFEDLDDTPGIIEVSSQHDIIINTTLGSHAASSKAYVQGLAKRKIETHQHVFMIHTSGTSNLADHPITGKYSDGYHVFSDHDNIYAYEHKRNVLQPYDQRTSELGVIDEGGKTGVKTLVIMSPLIYGLGTGKFNRLTIQVPSYIRGTLSLRHGLVIGDGKGEWDHVHIDDLVRLYELVLLKMMNGGKDLPFGESGIIFSEAGRHTWGEVAKLVAEAAYAEGKIKSPEVKSVSLKVGARVLAGRDELMAELWFASNSRTRGDVSRELGWRPVKGQEDWKGYFKEEVRAIVAKEGLMGSDGDGDGEG